jgi:hypothetical protein
MTLSKESQDELRGRLRTVERELSAVVAEREELERRQRQLSEEADALRRLVSITDEDEPPASSDRSSRPTVREIAIEIAKKNGGIVTAAEVFHATRPYGFKSDRGGIYTSLMQSASFEKVSPGRFEYIG